MSALTWLACEPDPPGADDARHFLETHEDAVSTLEREIEAAVQEVPWLEHAEPPCDEPAPESDDPLERRMWSMRCTQTRYARMEERDAAISALEHDVLPPILARAGAFSARLIYRRPGTAGLFHLGAVEPAPPTAREGAVRALEGVFVGERELGWGLFATRYTDAEGIPHGDETFVRGFEVGFHFDIGNARVDASVFFLEPG